MFKCARCGKDSDYLYAYTADGRVEVFGDLVFEAVEKDGGEGVVAELEGNKITVNINAVALPKDLLKYVVAHELAHILIKKHTERFWQFLGLIYPNPKEAHKLLTMYRALTGLI